MLALIFFLKAFAAQMSVDFLPLPWKGRVGILRNSPILAGALVGAIALLLNLNFLDSWTITACVLLSFLFGLTHSIITMRTTPAESHAPGRDETEAAQTPAPSGGEPRQPGPPTPPPLPAAPYGRAALRTAGLKLATAVVLALIFLIPFGGERFDYRVPRLDLSGLGWMLLRNIPLHAWLLGYLAALGPGSLLVGTLLANLQRQLAEGGGQSEEGLRYAGRLIGFFEAFIVVTLVAVNQWSAISFLVAAKAIGRFKQMDNQRFSEYFLIGTLANVSVAIIGGMIIRLVASVR